jgi:putative endonuclease
MAQTYILYSKTLDRYYIGHTGLSLEDRLRRHLSGHDGFTAKAKDWVIVWSRPAASETEAYALERTIKSWKSRQRIERLIEKG